MDFLTSDDYGAQIRQEQLDIVLSNAPADALHRAELFAQELIESHLRNRYDVAAVFGATGEERSHLIITYMVDIALYTVHSRHGRVAMPEKRLDRYDQAVAWLKAAAAGKISASLPALPVATAPGRFKWGSEPQQNLSW
jgi:phage gp36-like protein